MGSQPHDVTYPPLDVLKDVAADLWIVDSGPLDAAGIPLPVRMTVVRLSTGKAWLHSPTRFTEALRRDVEERVGPIRYLIAPNIAHWTFLQQWQAACPDAEVWAAPGLRNRRQVRKSGLRIDHELSAGALPEWDDEIDRQVVTGGLGFAEVTFLHKATRTLLLTDLVQNVEPQKTGLAARLFLRLAGSLAPNGKAPIYLRAAVNLNRREAQTAARRVASWMPDRVIFAHGKWFARDGEAELRRSWRWLL